jgi:hypothetical protein
MVKVTALLVLGVVLMGLGIVYFVMGWMYDVLGLVICSVLPFIVGFMVVLSEIIIERRKNKGNGNVQ